MTQQTCASVAGLSLSGLSKIESGRQTPRLETLHAIAKALGVEMVDLLTARLRPAA